MKLPSGAVLLALMLAALAVDGVVAEEVPLPVKKPKDANGQPLIEQYQPAAAVKAGDQVQSNEQGKTGGAEVKGVWPKTVDGAKEEEAAKANPPTVPTEWPADEIAAAQAMCTTILEKIDAVTIREPAFRQGDCGTAAPVRLLTIGKNPEVALSPPPVVTCGMVGALHTWLTKDLQPLAKRTLGADVIKIENMSDYSCRNAYGRTKTKLSEHGRANALDIRGFLTSKGETAIVLTGWGETKRDIAAREEAIKLAAEKAAAEAAKIARPAVVPSTAAPATAAGEASGVVVRKTITEGIGAGGLGEPAETPALGVAPQHLGGPERVAEPPARMKAFLKGAHTAACEIFGTTLGPEANNAHRNHFHVDMAPRKVKKICD